jgi:translation initiation factor eIF-2B subunit delta
MLRLASQILSQLSHLRVTTLPRLIEDAESELPTQTEKRKEMSPTPDVQDLTKAPQAASKPPKPTTKAERRELQEKQRAAKAAAAATAGPSTKAAKAPPSTSTLAVPAKKAPPAKDRDAGSLHGSEAPEAVGPAKSRGIRIFSHFGIPKPVTHSIKGDVHPAVIRLALLFSSFRICGANARCIATLTAFKNVRCLSLV